MIREYLTRLAGKLLSHHAHKQRRASVKERARQIRNELGLPDLRALK